MSEPGVEAAALVRAKTILMNYAGVSNGSPT